MAKFAKEFKGVKDGKIYPTVFLPGDDCPKELEAAAAELKALEQASKKKEEAK